MAKPIVTVEQGDIEGKSMTSYSEKTYFAFQGIPYAKPPLGKLRFKAPEAPEPWKGTLKATEENSGCWGPHLIFDKILGSEDCLYLNVYINKLPKSQSALKPVMVWIYGGKFTKGRSNADLYSPEYLLEEDIVFVSFNYRVGIFGVPGNAGLKDMVMALKWIQTNISKFGGDPNNVTIFGESAGGAACHFLMLSPMSKGLFHRAIAQSGTSLNIWAWGQRIAKDIAKILNFQSDSEKDILEFLQKQSTDDIGHAQLKIDQDISNSAKFALGAVVEKPGNEPAFLSEEPLTLLKSGRFHPVPFLTGFTNKEGLLLEHVLNVACGSIVFDQDMEKTIPYYMDVKLRSDFSKEIAESIKTFYFGDKDPSLETLDEFFALHGDSLFVYDIMRTAKYHAANGNCPVYLYKFALDGSINLYKKCAKLNRAGACHADDLGYLFRNEFFPPPRPESIEYITMRRMVKMWTSFARTGHPNPKDHTTLINVEWKPIQNKKLNFLEIGENLTVGSDPEMHRMEFWDHIHSMCANNCNYGKYANTG